MRFPGRTTGGREREGAGGVGGMPADETLRLTDENLRLITVLSILRSMPGAAVAPLREVSIHGDRSEQSSLPVGVTSGSDGRRAYVTCARGEFVAVVDLASAEVVDRIDARKGPDGVAYARPSTAKDEAP